MKRIVLAAAILAAVVLLYYVAASPRDQASDRLSVVTSTSILRSAVADVGADRVDVRALIAPGSCPGHYDVSPKDVKAVCSSEVVLMHGYEVFVEQLVKAAGEKKPDLVRVNVEGHWMVPEVYRNGIDTVAGVLSSKDKRNAEAYRESAAAAKSESLKLEKELQQQLRDGRAEGVAVFCSDQLKPVAEWMGFEVVATYLRAEELTPAKLHELTAAGREKNVRLVIDNLQSGPKVGKQLAGDIGAAHVTLSNFPGGFENTDSWASCVSDNVSRVIASLGDSSNRRDR